MGGINVQPTQTVEGSANPAIDNAYQGWPDGTNPAVDGKTVNDFAAAGDTDNILGEANNGPASYALGDTPD